LQYRHKGIIPSEELSPNLSDPLGSISERSIPVKDRSPTNAGFVIEYAWRDTVIDIVFNIVPTSFESLPAQTKSISFRRHRFAVIGQLYHPNQRIASQALLFGDLVSLGGLCHFIMRSGLVLHSHRKLSVTDPGAL
jgi:hypothetical protein